MGPRRITLSAVLFSFAACAAFGQFPNAVQQPPADLKRGWDSITSREGKEILTFLAKDCEGRGSAQPGFQKAANFVAGRFKAWGLKPMGDKGTYFQNVPFTVTHVSDRGSSIEFVGSGKTIPAGAAFRMTNVSASFSSSSVVAIIKPTQERLNLEGTDLRNHIVLLYADRADLDLRDEITFRGPSAILYVAATTPPANYGATRVMPGTSADSNPRRAIRVPIGTISNQAAADLLESLKTDDPKPARDKTPPITFTHGSAKLTVNVESQEVDVPNVVAMLPGSDAELKDEFVGIGAHLDHLGKQGAVIYPGADDDGSGTTAVLAIAHAMSVNRKKPKRSILFMTFCGEELGLVGSSWLVDHSMIPLTKMVAELQMDMIARDSYGPQNGDQRRMDVEKENLDTMRLVGSKRISTDLDDAIQQANKAIGFKFKYDAEDVYSRSDHYNFAKHGIPIAFLFDGFTPDYHQPTDTVDKIDWLKLTNTAKLYYLTAYAIADNPQAPRKENSGPPLPFGS